jgi:hypothetical protein
LEGSHLLLQFCELFGVRTFLDPLTDYYHLPGYRLETHVNKLETLDYCEVAGLPEKNLLILVRGRGHGLRRRGKIMLGLGRVVGRRGILRLRLRKILGLGLRRILRLGLRRPKVRVGEVVIEADAGRIERLRRLGCRPKYLSIFLGDDWHSSIFDVS